MAKKYIFRPCNEEALRWHPELGAGVRKDDYFEYVWFDGPMNGDDGKEYYIRISPFSSVVKGSHGAVEGGHPGIGFDLMLPDGKVIDEFYVYDEGDFVDEGFGCIMGGDQRMYGNVVDGKLVDYGFDVHWKNIKAKLSATVVAGGVQFVEDKHGYTAYDAVNNIATGWWPLAIRSDVTGTIEIDGKVINVTGVAYLDRQLGNMKSNFGTGAQAWWTWGHFWAGEYSGTFTDSAPSATYKYRHFSPFVLYKGKELILATNDFVGYIEQYALDNKSGKFYPKEQSQRAIDGNVTFYSQIQNGVLVEPETTSLEETCRYVRQFAEIKTQLMRYGGFRDDAKGKIVIEYGAGYHYFPAEWIGKKN